MTIKSIHDAMQQGILICDEGTRIVYFNDSYANFIGVSLKEAKGKLLTELRPNAVAPKVLKEGVAVRSLLRVEHGKEYFADVYPVVEGGKTVGTVSVVTTLEDAGYIKDKMDQLQREEEMLKARMNQTNGTHYTFDNIVGSSEEIRDTLMLAKRVAVHDANVLLEAESGCGKELFAQAIHNGSERCSGPFVAINCAALSKTMLESELFGYEDGAFTGAKKGGKAGLFETAKGGTLFLDEVSEMDYELQAKLLRVLQENKFRRIGGTKEIDTDVRVISACNVDLLQYIEEKKFRKDLYYRIAVFPIHIPPLRERKQDINDLADSFLQNVQIQHKRKYVLTEGVREAFFKYSWPGNIRELRNCVEFTALMTTDGVIDVDCLPKSMVPDNEQVTDESLSLQQRVKAFERQEILNTIKKYGNDTKGKKAAAKALGIALSSLYAKLEQK